VCHRCAASGMGKTVSEKRGAMGSFLNGDGVARGLLGITAGACASRFSNVL
jgi:hypothetical protein